MTAPQITPAQVRLVIEALLAQREDLDDTLAAVDHAAEVQSQLSRGQIAGPWPHTVFDAARDDSLNAIDGLVASVVAVIGNAQPQGRVRKLVRAA